MCRQLCREVEREKEAEGTMDDIREAVCFYAVIEINNNLSPCFNYHQGATEQSMFGLQIGLFHLQVTIIMGAQVLFHHIWTTDNNLWSGHVQLGLIAYCNTFLVVFNTA